MTNKINLNTMTNEAPAKSTGFTRNIAVERVKRTIILAALMIVASVAVLGQISDQKSDKDDKAKNEVIALADKYADALVKRDAAALELILADDYSGISTTGMPISKSLVIRSFKEKSTDPVRLEAINSNNLSVRIYDNTAVLITKVDLKWSGSQEDLARRQRSIMPLIYDYVVTLVAVRQNGSWRIVSTHESEASSWKGRESKD